MATAVHVAMDSTTKRATGMPAYLCLAISNDREKTMRRLFVAARVQMVLLGGCGSMVPYVCFR